MRKVYQFGLRPPTGNADMVIAQLRAAHDYRNDLVAIERGRRSALRAVDATDEVREAEALVVAATKHDRKAAVTSLRQARKRARDAAPDELARIAELEHRICLDARKTTTCYWGSYLGIEAAHVQARSAPLYGEDAVTPSDPRFMRWDGEGQLGVQLQKGASTAEILSGSDTRVKLTMAASRPGDDDHSGSRYGTLSLRVGSDGRAPVWAEFPIKLHRAVPDSAIWKWVRVSVRREGLRTKWSVEITVDDPAPAARTLDTDLAGTLAVEWEWTGLDDGSLRVARWCNSAGAKGDVILSARIAHGIRQGDGIRSVRDTLRNEMQPRLLRALTENKESLPRWLSDAMGTIPYWKSPSRYRDLARRWRRERCDLARDAYEILDTWEQRDNHLYDYESGARAGALRARRDFYRVVAAGWSRSYRTVLLSDQDLSREARFGDEGDRRFTAGCSELAGALRNAFGDDAVATLWRLPVAHPDSEDERPWCERVCGYWSVAGARDGHIFAEQKEKVTNAWAARKAKKKPRPVDLDGARKAPDNCAE